MRLTVSVDGSSLSRDVETVWQAGQCLGMLALLIDNNPDWTFNDLLGFMADFDDMDAEVRAAAEMAKTEIIVRDRWKKEGN